MSAADSVPMLSRRHAAGAGSARGLLFTVLGELVRPAGGLAWTSSFVNVLGRLGIEEKAARQALMRTASDGWLVRRRDGRRTSWQLTTSAEQLLAEGTDRIYGFAGVQPEWDGRWLVVLARAPERDRAARHVLRSRLAWAGLGSPSPGVWVSTRASRVPEVEAVLDAAGVMAGAQIFVGEYAGGGAASTLVRLAWDLDAVAERYRQFLASFADADGSDPLTAVVELVHAWRRFPWIDPALPTELLPPEWPGDDAAALFARQHARWRDEARGEWALLDGRGS